MTQQTPLRVSQQVVRTCLFLVAGICLFGGTL